MVPPPELVAVLLSWAAALSGYPKPATVPEIRLEPHAFFVEHACGGRECRVLGWYNDAHVIYLDEAVTAGQAELLVHELVHYLQDLSGDFDSLSCADSLARERQAYYVQAQFALTLGQIRGAGLMRASCEYSSKE